MGTAAVMVQQSPRDMVPRNLDTGQRKPPGMVPSPMVTVPKRNQDTARKTAVTAQRNHPATGPNPVVMEPLSPMATVHRQRSPDIDTPSILRRFRSASL